VYRSTPGHTNALQPSHTITTACNLTFQSKDTESKSGIRHVENHLEGKINQA